MATKANSQKIKQCVSPPPQLSGSLLVQGYIKGSERKKDVWRGKSSHFFVRSTGNHHLCFGRWASCYLLPFKGELEIVFCIWRTSPEPQRAKLDFKLGSDSLRNMAGMTRLTHGLDDRARKGAVLGLQYPGLLGQGCVRFPGRSRVGHAGENWSWVPPPGERGGPTDRV